MNATSNLNSCGQTLLAVAGSFVVNAAVHPLCTIKNRLMVNQPPVFISAKTISCFKALYRGYSEICLTESAAYAVTYVVNGILQKKGAGSLLSSVLAGIASSPVVTVGEAIMVKHQINGEKLTWRMLRDSMSGAGFLATLSREIPLSVAIFSFAPAIEKRITFANELGNHALAGLISGGICGALTAPVDKIKTLVQANELPFMAAARLVRGEFYSAAGQNRILIDVSTRAVYIGLSVALLNVLNHQLPLFFPNHLKK